MEERNELSSYDGAELDTPKSNERIGGSNRDPGAIKDVQIEVDDNDTEGSTFVDIRFFKNRNKGMKIFEMEKDTLVIRPARIVTKALKDGGEITVLECKKDCRYVEAKYQFEAEKKFIEMLTGKKYNVWKREQKKAGKL